jgi:hypothetical protein
VPIRPLNVSAALPLGEERISDSIRAEGAT